MFGEVRLIVTFPNTTAAMAFKSACEQEGIAGRLIPIPASLHAGCGQAWSAPLTARKQIEGLFEKPQISYNEFTLMQVSAEG